MPPTNPKPRSRPGLLVADHVKRGLRYITVLDRSRERVALLEPWEHAVLVLSDGSRTAEDIARVLGDAALPTEEGRRCPLGLSEVVRCLRFLEREGLVETMAPWLSAQATDPPGPRTLAALREAYREWHADPVRTGQILTGQHLEPFPLEDGRARRAWVGQTFVVGADGRAAKGRSADEPLAVKDLLQAIDEDLHIFEASGEPRDEPTQVLPLCPRCGSAGRCACRSGSGQ